MIAALIRVAIANRVFVLLAALVLAAVGVFSVMRTPLDALPDLSDTQVIIRTSWVGQSPQVVEDQITYPIVSALAAAPKPSARPPAKAPTSSFGCCSRACSCTTAAGCHRSGLDL